MKLLQFEIYIYSLTIIGLDLTIKIDFSTFLFLFKICYRVGIKDYNVAPQIRSAVHLFDDRCTSSLVVAAVYAFLKFQVLSLLVENRSLLLYCVVTIVSNSKEEDEEAEEEGEKGSVILLSLLSSIILPLPLQQPLSFSTMMILLMTLIFPHRCVP